MLHALQVRSFDSSSQQLPHEAALFINALRSVCTLHYRPGAQAISIKRTALKQLTSLITSDFPQHLKSALLPSLMCDFNHKLLPLSDPKWHLLKGKASRLKLVSNLSFCFPEYGMKNDSYFICSFPLDSNPDIVNRNSIYLKESAKIEISVKSFLALPRIWNDQ